VIGVGQSEGPEPCWLGDCDPDRSWCAEHGGSCKAFRSVPTPQGLSCSRHPTCRAT
jgi:hypothetical protein